MIKDKSYNMEKLTKIVLTGGPCSGKTTALAQIKEYFSNLGFRVFILPELPTMFSQAGVNFLTSNKSYFYQAEESLIALQIEMEHQFEKIAKAQEKPAIIVCDRGVMDISAYLSEDVWQAMLDDRQSNVVQLRDARYDAVIHMVTAANGAEKFYTNANNEHRSENIEQARALDEKLINAWTGHPRLRIVGNTETFSVKLNNVLSEISEVLGVPQPIEAERKYLVEVIGEIPNAVENDIYQTYLVSDSKDEVRLRKRGKEGSYVYFYTEKELSDTERIETERQITPREYVTLLEDADSTRETIYKKRTCFVWERQYFELDTFINPNIGITILEIECVNEGDVNLPPFIKVIEDVTGRKEYYNYNLAKKQESVV